MKRVLQECRIRGVKTNIGFLLNVLAYPKFESGIITKGFIDENPQLKLTFKSRWDFANAEQSDRRLCIDVTFERFVGECPLALRFV